MGFAIGFVLFALGITVSVALHECGHMWAAQATGMKVRRYFIGFGPKVFSFRRGETEYGLKALPLGGFCDIAGMTALDEIDPRDLDRAMYRQATWKRLIVMFGGIFMNFLLGFLLIMLMAVVWGLPRLSDTPPDTMIDTPSCVANEKPKAQGYESCTGTGPAGAAGLKRGDLVTAIDGSPITTWDQFRSNTENKSGPIVYTVKRDGQTLDITVVPQQATTYLDPVTKKPTDTPRTVSKVGVGKMLAYDPVKYNVLSAIPASASFTGTMFVNVAQSLAHMPAKVVSLWHAVTGGQRDQDTPISVYGASRIGGETAEHGLWNVFVLTLASLNFFLGAFNLLPLLPLDGGHIAVVIYEKLRNLVRGRRGLPPGAPVDYLKLLPATYVVVVIGGAYTVLTLVADVVNPIKLFP